MVTGAANEDTRPRLDGKIALVSGGAGIVDASGAGGRSRVTVIVPRVCSAGSGQSTSSNHPSLHCGSTRPARPIDRYSTMPSRRRRSWIRADEWESAMALNS
jgi:hypothetical protein